MSLLRPSGVRLRSVSTNQTREAFTFFWGGPFSQWFSRPFEIDGITYGCAEQWMMAGKARLFRDKAAEKAIMAARTPKEQKAIGRQVRGFCEEEWSWNAKSIVLQGTVAKFEQNDDLLDLLKATSGTTLVEASPYDRIWGIGLSANDARALNRATWRGKNLLGEVLTDARDNHLPECRPSGRAHMT